MLISEMFEHILVRSGQFLLGSSKIELNKDRFKIIVQSALGVFSRYKPVSITFNMKMQQNRDFTFTQHFQPIPGGETWGVPQFISSVTPTNIIGSPAFALMGQFGSKYGWSNAQGQWPANQKFAIPGQTQMESQQMEKSQFPWIFRTPKLYIPYSADVEVVGVWHHKIFDVPATEDNAADCRVDTVDYADSEFFDLLEGMFLIALGQSRRAFTLNDLPIVADADTLASTGKQLRDEAIEDLRTNKSKFYLAYGD